jgi:hypothetical protein
VGRDAAQGCAVLDNAALDKIPLKSCPQQSAIVITFHAKRAQSGKDFINPLHTS